MAHRTPPSTNAARRLRLSGRPRSTPRGEAPLDHATRLGAGRAAALNPFADLADRRRPPRLPGRTRRSPPSTRGPGVRAAGAAPRRRPADLGAAAFPVSTRGGWRVAGLDHTGAGELRVGSPAHLAVWRAEHLTVQAAARSPRREPPFGRLHRQVLRAPDRQVRR